MAINLFGRRDRSIVARMERSRIESRIQLSEVVYLAGKVHEIAQEIVTVVDEIVEGSLDGQLG